MLFGRFNTDLDYPAVYRGGWLMRVSQVNTGEFRMLKKFFLCAVMAFTAMSTSHATAQTIYANNVNEIASIIRDKGYRAQVTTDSDGDPLIKSSTDGINFSVYFYGCKDIACNAIQFSVGFNKSEPMDMSVMNSFNRRKLYGNAYLDGEGDPFLNYPVDMDGGLLRSNFDSIFKDWLLLVSEFSEAIDWN